APAGTPTATCTERHRTTQSALPPVFRRQGVPACRRRDDRCPRGRPRGGATRYGAGYDRRRGLPRFAGRGGLADVRPAGRPAAGSPAGGLRRAAPSSAFFFGSAAVGVRPRVLLTVRPRTMPMKSSTWSVVVSSRQDRATRDCGASLTGR